MAIAHLTEEIEDWLETRDGFVLRGLLVGYFVYGGVQHVRDPLYKTWFGGITLAFHEIGHVVFAPFGETMMLAGGSIFQLLIPLVASLYLVVRQRDWFGGAVGVTWLAFSMFELATYIEDASREDLPLVSFDGGYHHDWSTLLTRWHLLNGCDAIARMVRVLGGALWLAAVAFGGYLVFRIARRRLGR